MVVEENRNAWVTRFKKEKSNEWFRVGTRD